jgi:hypothetical protein
MAHPGSGAKKENGNGCSDVFYHGFHGLKRITRIKWSCSIKSQAHPNGECHKIHNSFLIREIRGFYFPFWDDPMSMPSPNPGQSALADEAFAVYALRAGSCLSRLFPSHRPRCNTR